MSSRVLARRRASRLTDAEMAACEVAARLMATEEVPADQTLRKRLRGLGWRREVTLLSVVLDIAKADGWSPEGRPPPRAVPRNAKLTEDDIIAIRRAAARMRLADIAQKYGVHKSTVSRILADHTYKGVG